jgi:hypothetical protein
VEEVACLVAYSGGDSRCEVRGELWRYRSTVSLPVSVSDIGSGCYTQQSASLVDLVCSDDNMQQTTLLLSTNSQQSITADMRARSMHSESYDMATKTTRPRRHRTLGSGTFKTVAKELLCSPAERD